MWSQAGSGLVNYLEPQDLPLVVHFRDRESCGEDELGTCLLTGECGCCVTRRTPFLNLKPQRIEIQRVS